MLTVVARQPRSLFLMSSSTFVSRMRAAWAASHPADHDPDPITLAGRSGEETLQRALRGLPSSSTLFNVFVGGNANRRPGRKGEDRSKASRGTNEIDALVLTPQHLYVIEVKNLGGTLTASKDFQTCTHVNSRKGVRECDNPILENRRKAQVLATQMIESKVTPPEGFIVPRVCFVNRSLEVSPDMSKEIDTILFADIEKFIKRLQSEYGKQTREVVDVLNRGAAYTNALRAFLAQLPTWDYVSLVGGEILSGKCYGIRPRGETEVRHFGRPTTGKNDIKLSHNRSFLVQGVKAAFGVDPKIKVSEPGKASYDIHLLGAVLIFRPVGKDIDVELPLNEVTAIEVSALPP